MGGQSLSVLLDKRQYVPGDRISGRVLVTTERPVQISGLYVKVVGAAVVRWLETETTSDFNSSSGTSSTFTTYSAKEKYFCFKHILVDRGVLHPGEHSFTFESQLPAELPSSFSCPYGEIKYGVKAKLVKSVNQKAWAEFVVDTPLDLNYEPDAMEAVNRLTETYFGCCWCKSGPLSLCVRLNHKGFAPGQAVCPTLEVDNASKVNLLNVECKVKEEVLCTGKSPRLKERFFTRDLVETSVGGLGRGLSTVWRPNLLLPLQSVNNIRRCSIISVRHSLQVTVKLSGCYSALKVTVPLVLGSQALRPESVPLGDPPDLGPPPSYDPPPSYASVVNPQPSTPQPPRLPLR